MPSGEWGPSRREARLLWWSRLIGYWVGLVGVVYEAFSKEVLGMLAFVILGTGVDVGRTTLSLVRMLREEGRAIEERLERDLARESGDAGSGS